LRAAERRSNKVLAWPGTVGFIIYLFRREIRPLLPYARLRLKHNETEVDLRLDMVTETAGQLPRVESLSPLTEEETERFTQ
jgi:hypothetical protein